MEATSKQRQSSVKSLVSGVLSKGSQRWSLIVDNISTMGESRHWPTVLVRLDCCFSRVNREGNRGRKSIK